MIQQSVIMPRQGVEIPLLENLGFKNNKAKDETETKSIAKAKQRAHQGRDKSPKGETEG